MMKRSIVVAAVIAGALCVSACVSVKLAPAGAYVAGDSGAALGHDWTDFTPLMPNMKKVHVLSFDGLLLNRLYLTEGLVTGDYFTPPVARKEATTPTYDAAMSVTEQVEFIADSVAALGYERVMTSAIQPVQVNGQRGVRFDIEMVNPDGLNYKARAQAVKSGEKMYAAVYIAPAEHYYQSRLASAEATMSSVTF